MRQIQTVPYIPGRARGMLRYRLEDCTPGCILVLNQEALVSNNLERVKSAAGLVVAGAARFSHALARLFTLGTPAVLIRPDQLALLPEGMAALIDGNTGLITLNPPLTEIWQEQIPPAVINGMVRSMDGIPVELRAGVPSANAALQAVRQGASRIGLLRSEFLEPLGGRIPDQQFYLAALREVFEAARPLGVTVRLLDIAPDKCPAWLHNGPATPLGLQGCRLYDREPVKSVFRAQVAAISELAAEYELALLLPYVTHPWEFAHWRGEIDAITGGRLPVGVMLETPASALCVSEWRALADFAAIGSNDLMQTLCAADRRLPEMADWLDPCSPALLRFLRQLADDLDAYTLPTQFCGQMPLYPGMLPVLLGLGFRIFSVEPLAIPHLAQIIANTDISTLHELSIQACKSPDARAVQRLLGLTQRDSLDGME
ncbi:MAG: phosphoenolpyruvate-protein phosphotransferase [Gammaproteobacteria bacterium]